MRRSSVWFIIALLWLVDTVLRVVRGNVREAWLPGVFTLIFVAVGFIHRRRENQGRENRGRENRPGT
jgi:hypothetical protein